MFCGQPEHAVIVGLKSWSNSKDVARRIKLQRRTSVGKQKPGYGLDALVLHPAEPRVKILLGRQIFHPTGVSTEIETIIQPGHRDDGSPGLADVRRSEIEAVPDEYLPDPENTNQSRADNRA